jgi:hypothetical protein
MDTIITVPTSCKVRAVIRFLHKEGQSAAEIHRRLCCVYMACTNALIKFFNWEISYHPPYSTDLAPNDYHLFTKMKVWFATQRSHTKEELMDGVNNWLHNLAALFFDKGLQKLVSGYDKCLNVDGNYVEK